MNPDIFFSKLASRPFQPYLLQASMFVLALASTVGTAILCRTYGAMGYTLLPVAVLAYVVLSTFQLSRSFIARDARVFALKATPAFGVMARAWGTGFYMFLSQLFGSPFGTLLNLVMLSFLTYGGFRLGVRIFIATVEAEMGTWSSYTAFTPADPGMRLLEGANR